jgi:hypothetical protein
MLQQSVAVRLLVVYALLCIYWHILKLYAVLFRVEGSAEQWHLLLMNDYSLQKE